MDESAITIFEVILILSQGPYKRCNRPYDDIQCPSLTALHCCRLRLKLWAQLRSLPENIEWTKSAVLSLAMETFYLGLEYNASVLSLAMETFYLGLENSGSILSAQIANFAPSLFHSMFQDQEKSPPPLSSTSFYTI